ncbi:MAG: hypothetical protein CM15mV120_190 [uncultured marine virus]|nr:MAG: hypothetical protein CM15mV120_190 [uncultured marine virus]
MYQLQNQISLRAGYFCWGKIKTLYYNPLFLLLIGLPHMLRCYFASHFYPKTEINIPIIRFQYFFGLFFIFPDESSSYNMILLGANLIIINILGKHLMAEELGPYEQKKFASTFFSESFFIPNVGPRPVIIAIDVWFFGPVLGYQPLIPL